MRYSNSGHISRNVKLEQCCESKISALTLNAIRVGSRGRKYHGGKWPWGLQANVFGKHAGSVA